MLPGPLPTGPLPAPDLAGALAGCARREPAALRVLYDALAPRMLGVALRLLRRRDLAEEVVHDAFLRVWERAGSYDPARGEAATWVFAVLRHRALNVLRDGARLDLVDEPERLERPAAWADGAPDAEAAVAALSASGALRRCLERLEPARREAVVLAHVRGLSHGELAGRLGVPLGTAKSWVRRGLLSLRECLS